MDGEADICHRFMLFFSLLFQFTLLWFPFLFVLVSLVVIFTAVLNFHLVSVLSAEKPLPWSRVMVNGPICAVPLPSVGSCVGSAKPTAKIASFSFFFFFFCKDNTVAVAAAPIITGDICPRIPYGKLLIPLFPLCVERVFSVRPRAVHLQLAWTQCSR